MTQKEYEAQRLILDGQIEAIEDQIKALNDRYLSFSPFKVGDIVDYKPSKNGFNAKRAGRYHITHMFVRYGKRCYELFKVKKDGTPGNQHSGLYDPQESEMTKV